MSINRAENHWEIKVLAGVSGDEILECAWLATALRVFETFCTKQRDYSANNIARHQELGVLVRADDKLARLKNLLTTNNTPSNESALDSWLDLAGYAIIGMMCNQGVWPRFQETDLWEQTRDAINAADPNAEG